MAGVDDSGKMWDGIGMVGSIYAVNVGTSIIKQATK